MMTLKHCPPFAQLVTTLLGDLLFSMVLLRRCTPFLPLVVPSLVALFCKMESRFCSLLAMISLVVLLVASAR